MGVVELLKNAPRDFYVLLVLTYFQSLVLFGVFGIVMWILTENCGFSDSVAGLLFGCFSSCTAVYGFVMGPFIDTMLIRKTLLFHLACVFTGQIIMSASLLHPIAVCMALFLPMALGFSVMHAVISIALQRYIPDSHRDLAYPLRYSVMNMGAFTAPFIVDTFRLKLPAFVFGTQLPRWSFFLMCCALLEIPLFLLVFFGIRDIEVTRNWTVEKLFSINSPQAEGTEGASVDGEIPLEQQDNSSSSSPPIGGAGGVTGLAATAIPSVASAVPEATEATTESEARGWRAVKDTLLHNVMFRRFLLLCAILVGAHSVFVYDYSLYPIYMKRAPFPVLDPSSIPFMWFLSIDPLLVAIMAIVIGILAQRYSVERYWTIVVGSAVGACAPFFMMSNTYWGVVLFMVVMAVGESLWSPFFDRYVCEFTEKGKEGIFFGLSGIITTTARLLTNVSSGLMLSRFCSAAGACEEGKWIWFIAGWIAFSTPVLLLLTMRWTRLKPTEVPYAPLDDPTIPGGGVVIIDDTTTTTTTGTKEDEEKEDDFL